MGDLDTRICLGRSDRNELPRSLGEEREAPPGRQRALGACEMAWRTNERQAIEHAAEMFCLAWEPI